MRTSTIEERVTALEKQVAELLANGAGRPAAKDWRSTMGMFTGDEFMKRLDRAALKYARTIAGEREGGTLSATAQRQRNDSLGHGPSRGLSIRRPPAVHWQ